MGEKPRSLRKRLLTLAIGVAVYVALLVASRAVESARPAEEITRPQVMLPEFVGAAEASGGRRVRVTYLEWEAGATGERSPEVGRDRLPDAGPDGSQEAAGSDPAGYDPAASSDVVENANGSSEQAGEDRGGDAPARAFVQVRGGDAQAREAIQSRPAVLLLHGSPGDAANFASGTFADGTVYRGLGERLAARGYRVIAPDLPGFGQSEKWIADYSIEAHAAYCLALMDALGIDRFHAVGWSMGGGVVLHLADMAPDRVASATLMASIGTQESEGSGDYWFEHFKYAVGYTGLVVGVDLVPHFGVLPERWFRHSSMRNFLDTDMRPLRRILTESRVPLLVLHGRYDVLAGVRGAEEAAALSARSRLVVNGANHFLPIAQAQEMEGRLARLFARHDSPGVEPLAGVADLAPAARRIGADAFVHRLGRLTLGVAWWVTALVIGLLASRRPRATMVLCALVITTMTLDFGVAAVGVLGGWAWRERRGRGAWGTARLLLWVPIAQFALLIAAWQVVMPWVEGLSAGGVLARAAAWVMLGASIIAGASLVAIVPEVWTWRGRRRLLASWSRLAHHEWWPASVFYLPVWAWLAWLSLRHAGPLVFTCANPGIPGGGGIIGESKSQILDALGDEAREFVLPVRLIESGASPAERAVRALAVIRGEGGEACHGATGGEANPFAYPVILKPDMAYRGFA
ncbi:MAG: alpha/beta hydrolase, partial [Phycisphaerales bacterium]